MPIEGGKKGIFQLFLNYQKSFQKKEELYYLKNRGVKNGSVFPEKKTIFNLQTTTNSIRFLKLIFIILTVQLLRGKTHIGTRLRS